MVHYHEFNIVEPKTCTTGLGTNPADYGKPTMQLVGGEAVRLRSHESPMYRRHRLVLFTKKMECFS